MLMLVTMLLGSAAQCVRRGLAEPPGSRSPAFAFAGIFVAVFVALGTVYLGEQVLPTLFFMLGWAQGWLQIGGRVSVGSIALPLATAPRFRSVIH
jgi:hypothetical protein